MWRGLKGWIALVAILGPAAADTVTTPITQPELNSLEWNADSSDQTRLPRASWDGRAFPWNLLQEPMVDHELLLGILRSWHTTDPEGDLDGDGMCDVTDLWTLSGIWHQPVSVLTPTRTPSPSATLGPTFTSTSTSTQTPVPTVTPALTEKVFFIEPHVTIPDGDPAGITSTITVPEDWYIARLQVGVWISHPFSVDLEVSLTGPDGTLIVLYVGYCDDYDIWGVYGVDYTPHGPGNLNNFVGENARGEWRLTVADTWEEDIGTLERWELRILGSSTFTPLPTPTTTPTPEGTPVCVADYFPIADGLSWSYSSNYGPGEVTMDYPVSFCGTSCARIASTFDDTTQYGHFRFAGDALLSYGNYDYSLCDNPLFLGDCTIRDGSVFRHDIEVEGFVFTFIVRWSFVGSQTVPAGTFDDCFDVTVTVLDLGTWDVWTVAPAVGRIRIAVVDECLNVWDQAELTSSSLLGSPSLKGGREQSAYTDLPEGSFLATPESFLKALLRKGDIRRRQKQQ